MRLLSAVVVVVVAEGQVCTIQVTDDGGRPLETEGAGTLEKVRWMVAAGE